MVPGLVVPAHCTVPNCPHDTINFVLKATEWGGGGLGEGR